MAPSVQLIHSVRHGSKPVWDRKANRGRQSYLVSNVIPEVAKAAPGIPLMGDAYGTDLPGAFVQSISVERIGGGVKSTDGGYNADLNGWSIVNVQYGPPEQFGITPDLSAWTEEQASVRSQRVMYEVDIDTGIPDTTKPKLASGDGANVMAGWVEMLVHTFHLGSVNSALYNYTLNLMKPCAVNDSGLVFPRVGGPNSFGSVAVGPGQALYMSRSISDVAPGILRLTHQIAISQDFKLRWRTEKEDGESLTLNTSDVYRTASYTGIW